MPYLYILQSEVNQTYYIGSTIDLTRRLAEHERGKSKYTKLIRPVKLVFVQEYETVQKARTIERKLKLFKSRNIIERIIKDGTIKIK